MKVAAVLTVLTATLGTGVAAAAENEPAGDVTRAQYDKVETGMEYQQVVEILGREGVREIEKFYVWPEANLRVGVKKDGTIGQYGIHEAGARKTQRYKEFETAFDRKVDRGERLTYDQSVEVMGKPGKRAGLAEYTWTNSNKAKIKIMFSEGKVTSKLVLGRLK